MKYNLLVLVLATLPRCAPSPDIRVGQCYVSNFSLELGPKDPNYEINKVDIVTASRVKCSYTFPNDPVFKGKWHIGSGPDPYIISTYDKDYLLTYYKRTQCPY